MFNVSSTTEDPESVLIKLRDFELCCMGEKKMSPSQFQVLNMELSRSAVDYIGKTHYQTQDDGQHLIWCSEDGQAHDMGPLDDLKVCRDYPGFHKYRSQALGHGHTIKDTYIDIPFGKRQINIVEMEDGSRGIGLNYKIALRNAALKFHLKKVFNYQNRRDVWKRLYGHT